MDQRCGIDTSILVRLVSGQPQPEFKATLSTLTRMVEVDHVALPGVTRLAARRAL